MNKKLAIKGHLTRGKEVIEILEMLGGKNDLRCGGNLKDNIYSINEQGIIDWTPIDWNISYPDSHLVVIFTLEKFLEEFPYKVGDKVLINAGQDICTIKSMIWDKKNGRVAYRIGKINGILENNNFWFANDMERYLEQKEETVGETIIDTIKESKDRYRLHINYQYEIEVDEGEYYVVRRKPQYPKSYEGCCDILQLEHIFELKDLTIDEEKLTDSFIRLKRCRDAYWKIAGEQMGLGKPWEPDWGPDIYHLMG